MNDMLCVVQVAGHTRTVLASSHRAAALLAAQAIGSDGHELNGEMAAVADTRTKRESCWVVSVEVHTVYSVTAAPESGDSPPLRALARAYVAEHGEVLGFDLFCHLLDLIRGVRSSTLERPAGFEAADTIANLTADGTLERIGDGLHVRYRVTP